MNYPKLNNIVEQFKGFLKTPNLFLEFDYDNFQFPEVQNFSIEQPSRSMLIGKKAELFLEKIINDSSSFKLELSNKQIIKDGKTIGEIDYLVSDENGNDYHVELSYKFYLWDFDFGHDFESRWVGPNRKDRLSLKQEKLLEHQFPVLFNEELNTLTKGKNYIQQVVFKSQLFLPLGINEFDFKYLNPDCLAGYWIGYLNFIKLYSNIEVEFFRPDKEDWFCEVFDDVPWQGFDKIINELNLDLNQNRSPMLWLRYKGQIMKLFVVWW